MAIHLRRALSELVGSDAVPHKYAQPFISVKQVLRILVKGTDGSEVHFKVKSTTKLKKLMDAYCMRVDKYARSLRFFFDGDQIAPDSTFAELEMEEGDAILARSI